MQNVLGPTANPAHPEEVQVSRPSDALQARAEADSAFTSLLLGLGAVALLVGGVGIANVMVISVLERRQEIGVRRALGATRAHVRRQFLTEALALAAIGGVAGVVLGAVVTAVYASTQDEQIVVPLTGVLGGVGASILVGRDRRAVPGGAGGAAGADRGVAVGLDRARCGAVAGARELLDVRRHPAADAIRLAARDALHDIGRLAQLARGEGEVRAGAGLGVPRLAAEREPARDVVGARARLVAQVAAGQLAADRGELAIVGASSPDRSSVSPR